MIENQCIYDYCNYVQTYKNIISSYKNIIISSF